MFKIDKISDSITLGMLDLALFNTENKLEKRELEKSGIQHLLKLLFVQKPVTLAYTATNKPYLEGENLHISISHSHDKLVILVNKNESTGVDIELLREKVKNIQHKFLNNEELVFADNDPEKLTVLWAAKEAIYKAYGLKEVDFIDNLFIEPFADNESNFMGRIDLPGFSRKYLMNRQKIGEYILVLILNEVQ